MCLICLCLPRLASCCLSAPSKTQYPIHMEEEQAVVKLPLIEAECSARLRISNIDYDQENGGVGSLNSAGARAPVETRSTPVLFVCTFAAACAAFTGGCLVSYTSPAESGIIADLSLTVTEYSFFGSIMTAGAMIGAVISGRMTDFIGRRLGAWLLDLGRLSLGIGFGLTCYVGPAYLAEIIPKDIRGLLMSISQSMTGYGASLTFVIGSFVTWRSLAIIGCIPSLLLLLALFFIPESPRWLDYIENQRLQQNSDDNVLNLFRRKYLHIVIVGVGLMVVQASGGLYGFMFYMSEIFDSAGISSTLGFILVAVLQVDDLIKILLVQIVGYIDLFLASFFENRVSFPLQIPLIVLSAALIDKFGRRTLLMASATGQCLGCLLTGLSYFLQELDWWKEASPILALIGVLVYMGSYAFGMGGIPWIVVSEIFPINVKGSAGTLCNLVSSFCSWVVSYTFNYSFSWSPAGTFFIYAGICGFGVVFIAKLVPETKGRTLEEIHASLTRIMQ
ncbi:sugar transporter ERD6-like 5 isoform X3 [Carya illinoinensis]|uniref:sugar transporter ERD6-like 5 isoform X3 n=1 Tax=Carya illinoinensis TaxID=32201 RepID=UPI001C7209D8|nr:sugar transporter ERD6-like 5 isoform X3 [Carya illinoinensis]